jgi:hypothetical protein
MCTVLWQFLFEHEQQVVSLAQSYHHAEKLAIHIP